MKFVHIFPVLVMASSIACFAQAPAGKGAQNAVLVREIKASIEPVLKSEQFAAYSMADQMGAAVEAVARMHDYPAFTQVFTNEPDRAARIRARFVELEKLETLEGAIQERELQLKRVDDELEAKKALLVALERKITATRLSAEEGKSP